jgi:hypothetical protein
LKLASILEAHWPRYVADSQRRHAILPAHHDAVAAVCACRTAALGGQRHDCDDCAKTYFAYHSCNHRACPQCGGQHQHKWAAAQQAKLLPGVPCFMLTFTLPEQMRPFARQHQPWFYDAMFEAMSSVLKDFAQDKRHLGGMAGFTAVLHTWTRQLQYHPHLHVIMPGIALREDGLRVLRAKGAKYLFPVKALGTAFRNRMSRLILQHDREEHTRHHSQIDPQVWRLAWVIDSRSVGDGQNAVRYLARYVSKTALSEQRLLGYDEHGNIRLNCQSSATGQCSVIALTPAEFIRRWSQHVLPKGLMRVRHYGYLSAAAKARLERLRQLLGVLAPPPAPPIETPKCQCPCCGKAMRLKARINPLPLWRDLMAMRFKAQATAVMSSARAPPRVKTTIKQP